MKRHLLLLAVVVLLPACGGSGGTVDHPTVWLCSPGQREKACTIEYTFTELRADGSTERFGVEPMERPAVDCFYVYPTVETNELTGNTDLVPGDGEVGTARLQAAWFSSVCRLFAPMYRQTTGFRSEDPALQPDRELAYADVRAAWQDYLDNYNDGRGFVLIGHSQGTNHLRRLIREEIEGDEETRSRLVSALLIGAGVIEKGDAERGDFEHVPPCATTTETGCVVAYSTWSGPPPADASFQNVDDPAQRILCVNPAALEGGTALINPIFPWWNAVTMGGELPSRPRTEWVMFPGLYRARCERDGSRAWLQVERATGAGDPRPIVDELTPGWGYHHADVNLLLGDLVSLVEQQSKAYAPSG